MTDQMFAVDAPGGQRAAQWLDARGGLSIENVALCAAPLGLTAGIRVVDLGCGTGVGTAALARLAGAGGAVLGIDRHPALLAAARRHGGPPQLRFKRADACATGEHGASWDACWIDRVLAHCADPCQVIAEAARLLRPGGRLFSCEMDYAGLHIDDCSPTLARSLDDYRAAFARPSVAAELMPWLQAAFPRARIHQQRQHFRLTTRSALLQSLGVPLWLRGQMPAAVKEQALWHDARRELGARSRAGRLNVQVPVQWTLLWTARGA
jgi:ubiquinone/menaquinone biosynthesis C-methylase UbiE